MRLKRMGNLRGLILPRDCLSEITISGTTWVPTPSAVTISLSKFCFLLDCVSALGPRSTTISVDRSLLRRIAISSVGCYAGALTT